MTPQTGSCPQNTTKSLIRTYLGQRLWLAPREVAQRQPRPGGSGWSSVLIPNSAIQNDKGKYAPKAAILLAIQTAPCLGLTTFPLTQTLTWGTVSQPPCSIKQLLPGGVENHLFAVSSHLHCLPCIVCHIHIPGAACGAMGFFQHCSINGHTVGFYGGCFVVSHTSVSSLRGSCCSPSGCVPHGKCVQTVPQPKDHRGSV